MSELNERSAELEAQLNAALDAEEATDEAAELVGDEVRADAAAQADSTEAETKAVEPQEQVAVDAPVEADTAPAGDIEQHSESSTESGSDLPIDDDGNNVPSWAKFSKEKRARRRAVRELKGAEKRATEAEQQAAARALEIKNLHDQLSYTKRRFGDEAVMPVGLDDAKLATVREQFGDDIADALEGLSHMQGQGANAPSTVQTDELDANKADAPKGDTATDATEQSLDGLLDIVPDESPVQKLGLWQDTKPELLEQAVAVEATLQNDPTFEFKDDPEKFYTEVVRRVELGISSNTTNVNTDGAGASAPNFKESAPAAKLPASLSDAPGAAVAEPEGLAALQGMTPKQMMEWRDKLSPEQRLAVEDQLFG